MTEEQVYQVFDEGGTLSKGFHGYEYRDGQLQMALKVREAYERDGILVVEAGTGIGKSFAYLVPALLHALEKPDERTVVATSTINLQKQLYEKDIPMLFKLLGTECKVALAVGRGNYLCLRRFLAKRDESWPADRLGADHGKRAEERLSLSSSRRPVGRHQQRRGPVPGLQVPLCRHLFLPEGETPYQRGEDHHQQPPPAVQRRRLAV